MPGTDRNGHTKHIFFFIIFLTCITLPQSIARTQTKEDGKDYNSILIIFIPDGSDKDEGLETIAGEALRVELEQNALDVELLHDLSPETENTGPEALIDAARAKGFDLLGIVSYRTDGRQIHVELSCYDVNSPAKNVSVTKTGNIDLTLDTLFSSAIQEIIPRFEENIGKKEITRNESAPEERPEIEQELAEHIYISVGTAPFLTAGKTNYYFNIGSLSSLYGRYVFTTSAGDISVGLYSGVNYFEADGLLLSAQNILLPIGVDVQYGSSNSKQLSVFVRLTGGMAVFIFIPETGTQLAKLLPYMSAGAGVTLRFRKLIGISLDFSYYIFFEEYYPIMGLAPSIYLNFRF